MAVILSFRLFDHKGGAQARRTDIRCGVRSETGVCVTVEFLKVPLGVVGWEHRRTYVHTLGWGLFSGGFQIISIPQIVLVFGGASLSFRICRLVFDFFFHYL